MSDPALSEQFRDMFIRRNERWSHADTNVAIKVVWALRELETIKLEALTQEVSDDNV